MGDVLRFRKPSATERAKGKTFCARGFHKWVVTRDNRFDNKQGGLVTEYRCARCGAVRTRAH